VIDVRPGLNLVERQFGLAGLNERREILGCVLRLLRLRQKRLRYG
jgi:hypothetical protein